MKTLKTKVILSAFVLLFALVATIGSTYAWFTVSSSVSVETVNIDVIAQDSLLIRLYDGEDQTTANAWIASDFEHAVSITDLQDDNILNPYYNTTYMTAGVNDILTATLFPMTAASAAVTTGGTDYAAVDPRTLAYVDITDTSDRTLTSGSANGAGGYIEMKFWIMSQSAGHTITIEDLNITDDLSLLEDNISDGISLGTIEEDMELTTPNYHVFSINPDYAFAFVASDTGFITQDGTHENPGTPTSSWNACSSPGTLAGLNSLFFDTAAVANTSANTLGGSAIIATLLADQVELITVRIWLEGWDTAADNDIIAENFNIDFKFTING